MRLATQGQARWINPSQFLRVAAQMMRRILVNSARDRHRLKRGGQLRRGLLDTDSAPVHTDSPLELIAVDEALDRLDAIDARKAEIVQLRFFAGLTIEETASALRLSPAQIKREWAVARAWLMRELDAETSP